MSEFKVGDRVKLSGEYGGWYSGNEGKTGTITRITHEWTYVTFDNSKGDTLEDDYGNPELLELISRPTEIPPATITHEGYTYNRGERVRPEWLKDGAWVVTTKDGELIPDVLYQLVEQEDGFYTKGRSGSLGKITVGFINSFRPHEPSDYKWGDWAMYEGKKVFVMNYLNDTGIEITKPPVYKKTLDGWDIVPSSELTPTHAP